MADAVVSFNVETGKAVRNVKSLEEELTDLATEAW